MGYRIHRRTKACSTGQAIKNAQERSANLYYFRHMKLAALCCAGLNPGELTLSAHLWLVFTGLPSALLSLHFHNGLAFGVCIAGAVGRACTTGWLVGRAQESAK